MKRLCTHYQQHDLVLIIDEYSAPLIHSELAANNKLRDYNLTLLNNVLLTAKTQRKTFAKVVVTGAAGYSLMGFSPTVNCFTDLSDDPDMQTLFGFTQEELELHFVDHLDECAAYFKLSTEQLLQVLRDNYDGYYFSQEAADQGSQGVYNPATILSFFANY